MGGHWAILNRSTTGTVGLKLLLDHELLIGARNFGEKSAEFAGVFFAGAGFDATGNVHRIGPDGDDGFTDIFRSEASGEKNWKLLCGAGSDFPICKLTAAAVGGRTRTGRSGIEKKRRSRSVPAKFTKRKFRTSAKRLDDRKKFGAARCGNFGFVAMKLDGAEP